MVVTCPGCGTRYSIDESRVSDRGARLSCRGCGKSWTVHLPLEVAAGPDPADDEAAAAAPPPPPAILETSGSLQQPVSCPQCGHLFVPYASKPAADSTDSTGGRPAPRARVLVVEDQNYFAELTRESLGEEVETVVASNLGAARSMLSQGTYDLVILDLSLEGDQDGTLVLQATRSRKIPVLIFTARDETEMYGAAWEALKAAGASDILFKGMNVGDDLRRKVQAMLSTAGR